MFLYIQDLRELHRLRSDPHVVGTPVCKYICSMTGWHGEEGEGLCSVSAARPPAVRPVFEGEARGRCVWAVASVKSREESGQHDDQHPIQEPDPGENRWVIMVKMT